MNPSLQSASLLCSFRASCLSPPLSRPGRQHGWPGEGGRGWSEQGSGRGGPCSQPPLPRWGARAPEGSLWSSFAHKGPPDLFSADRRPVLSLGRKAGVVPADSASFQGARPEIKGGRQQQPWQTGEAPGDTEPWQPPPLSLQWPPGTARGGSVSTAPAVPAHTPQLQDPASPLKGGADCDILSSGVTGDGAALG